MSNIVIIGGGAAGLCAAQSARQTDPATQIFLLCGEGRLPYYRTRICETPHILEESKLDLRSPYWYEENRIHTIFERATSINLQQKLVKCADGRSIGFDRLILATGSQVISPRFQRSDDAAIIPLRTLNDLHQLNERSGAVAIVGDGTLAVTIALSLARNGRDVTILGKGRHLLDGKLDNEGSSFLLHLLEHADIRIALQADLEKVEKQRVIMADGRAFDAHTTVLACGVVSNNPFSSLELDQGHGIRVNSAMLTSQPYVFAAGDCAEFAGNYSPSWAAAVAQGTIAGINAAGGEANYRPESIPFLLQTHGLRIWSYGNLKATALPGLRDIRRGRLLKLFAEQDTIAGAELIGFDNSLLRLKKAIDEHAPLEQALQLTEEIWQAAQTH